MNAFAYKKREINVKVFSLDIHIFRMTKRRINDEKMCDEKTGGVLYLSCSSLNMSIEKICLWELWTNMDSINLP